MQQRNPTVPPAFLIFLQEETMQKARERQSLIGEQNAKKC